MHSNSCFKKKTKTIKIIKLSYIFIILLTSIIYNIYCTNTILILRILCSVSLIGLTLFIFLYVEEGKKILSFANKSKKEIKKIIWPSNTETLYTTLIVSIIAITMSLVIWGLDNILFQLVSFITNLRL
ncbi:preprotein translocase subunit SecE [Buchnera aphidicola]|uniref:preprotein translocase subunit SecE n=1 Tax=Buchnera aphidicola TaxID=9 RepID=UPI00346485E3